MKIWSMLQVLSPENEKKKKLNDSLCTVFVCDGGRFVHIGRRGSGTKEEEKEDKGSIAFIGSRIKNIHTLPCVLPGPLYDVIAVPSLFLL